MKLLPDHELGHMRTLVRMACVDGPLNDKARRALRKIAASRAVEASRVDVLLDSGDEHAAMFIPDGLGNRMGLLHDLMVLAYLDGSVTPPEKSLLDATVRAFNFRPQLADHLIDLFRYGSPSPSEWNDFVDHVKQTFVEGQ
jgi:hypothetical protein